MIRCQRQRVKRDRHRSTTLIKTRKKGKSNIGAIKARNIGKFRRKLRKYDGGVGGEGRSAVRTVFPRKLFARRIDVDTRETRASTGTRAIKRPFDVPTSYEQLSRWLRGVLVTCDV